VDELADRSRLAHSVPHLEAMALGQRARALSQLVEGNPSPAWDVQAQVLEAQPFFRYVVHDALAEAGRADLVADACRDWKVFLDAGETTWPETWAGGTRCHGWSSTPTRDLVVHTLGISPAEPGFARARVAPRLGDLDWAHATVPLPLGPLTVHATRGRVEVDSPVGVELDDGRGVTTLSAGRHVVDLEG
jgi:alpha-L-rhamnosidase